MKSIRIKLLSGFLLCSTMLASDPSLASAEADTAKQLRDMQKQILALQAQIQKMQKQSSVHNNDNDVAELSPPAGKSKTKTHTKTVAVAGAPAATPAEAAGLQNKSIKLTVGGFVEAAAINRSRSESADLPSSWVGIPLPISSGNHLSEFRASARQSRLSLLAQGNVDANTELAAYFESDFLGAAPTANSNESNSYTPRLRQTYATLDRYDLGVHILGGQAWSLVTLNKKGIMPRQENVPQTIDAQYVPGFTWTRNPQVRFVKDFADKKVWAGVSLESPQAIVSNGPNTPTNGAPIYNLGGGSGFASTNNYTTDIAPDVIAKVAFDPGYGHYEVFGLGRFFRDRTHIGGKNDTVTGGGVGAGAILPIINKKLEFQVSGLIGKGVGRYGSVQLPDVTVKPDGSLATVGGAELLAGLTAHPDDQWDLYAYAGMERSQKTDFKSGSHGFGYGSALYNNSGCNTEGAAASTCVANTKEVGQVTAGAWWKFYKGSYGMMETGVQDSFSKRFTFRGVGGAPSANENVTMVSFRYYPF